MVNNPFRKDLISRIRSCSSKEQAKHIVDQEILRRTKLLPSISEEKAREMTLSDIGYLTGYFPREEAYILLELFETKHPYFGRPGEWPTSEEILKNGV